MLYLINFLPKYLKEFKNEFNYVLKTYNINKLNYTGNIIFIGTNNFRYFKLFQK